MQDAVAHCEQLVRSGDRDRWLATLFAPADRRAALFALYAFNLEIARVREAVRDPMAGQVRLQWWIDALNGNGHGAVAAHPVAAALCEAILRRGLPVPLLTDLIEARFSDLDDEAPETIEALEFYARRTASALILVATRILGDEDAPELGECAEHAGIAYGLTGLLRALPAHAARGKLFLPLDRMRHDGLDPHTVMTGTSSPALRAIVSDLRAHAGMRLARLRPQVERLPSTLLPAFLPGAPVPALLKRLARAADDPFRLTDLPAWRRQWLIWRAARAPIRLAG